MQLQDIVRHFENRGIPAGIIDAISLNLDIITTTSNALLARNGSIDGLSQYRMHLADVVIKLCQYSQAKAWDLQIVQSSSFERYFPEGVREESLWYEFFRQIVNDRNYATFDISMKFIISMVYFFAQRIGVPDLDSEIEKLLISKYDH